MSTISLQVFLPTCGRGVGVLPFYLVTNPVISYRPFCTKFLTVSKLLPLRLISSRGSHGVVNTHSIAYNIDNIHEYLGTFR